MAAHTTMVSEFPWDPRYAVACLDDVMTPALVIYPDIITSNIERTVHLLGGDAARWRVHVKTSKLGYTLRLLVERGVRNFKCATTLELLAACQCGASAFPFWPRTRNRSASGRAAAWEFFSISIRA